MLNKNAFLPSSYKFFMVLFAFCLLAVHSVEPYERRTPVVEAVQKVLPTVVNISTRSTKQITVYRQTPFSELFNHPFSPLVSPFGERETYQVESVGSGVVVENGYIVTNNHVIASDTGSAIHVADEIFVTLYEDQKQLKARVVGADPRADIAILKIDASPSNYLPWGRSDDLMIGETVIGIGNALGQPFTVTSGIISALNRSITTENDMRLFNLIQTDADINRGNSGGPLVNINGEFIGLNTVIISPSGGSVGVGFAIPVLRVKNIYDYWIHNILSVEDQMGLEIQEMDTYLEHHFRRFYPNLQNEKLKGVVVLEVSPGGLCDGKLQSADIIHHVDGETVESISDLRSILEEHSGSTLAIDMIREGKKKSVSVAVPKTQVDRVSWLGMEIQEIDNPYRRWFGIPENYKGLIIHSIQKDGPADKVNLKRGDVIAKMNRKTIRSLNQFHQFKRDHAKTQEVLIQILRKTGENNWQEGAARIQQQFF